MRPGGIRRVEGRRHCLRRVIRPVKESARYLGGIARQRSVIPTAADGDALPIPPGVLPLQLRVVGSFFGSRQDLRELLILAERHAIRPIIERYPLDGINGVHVRMRRNAVRFRAVIVNEDDGISAS